MNKVHTFSFSASIWKYGGGAAWYFVGVPHEVSEHIREASQLCKIAFGSVPVRTTIGNTTWTTSVFPDAKTKTYLLPIKASVRKAEGIFEGDEVRVTVALLSASTTGS